MRALRIYYLILINDNHHTYYTRHRPGMDCSSNLGLVDLVDTVVLAAGRDSSTAADQTYPVAGTGCIVAAAVAGHSIHIGRHPYYRQN